MKKCTICGEEYSSGTLKCKCDCDYTQDILNFPSLTKFSTQQLKEELQKIETAKQLYEEKTRPKTPFEQDLKGAQAGDPVAQFNLAFRYETGDGVEKNLEEAFRWYNESAKQGYAPAQNNLGVCYARGEGTKQDQSHAYFWYLQAAEKGYALAQYNLASCYKFGTGTLQKDPRQAFYWYSQSANKGYAKSQYKLGQCYENGIGTDIDYQKALEWYDKAAKQGNKQAEEAALNLREKIATQCNDLIRGIDRLPSSITFRNITNVRALKDKFDELQEHYKRMIENKNKLDDALEQVAAIEKNISRLKPDEDKKNRTYNMVLSSFYCANYFCIFFLLFPGLF